MSDEELLSQGEDLLLRSRLVAADDPQLTPLYLESIAASLLVIARNSVMQTEGVPEKETYVLRADGMDHDSFIKARKASYADKWNEEKNCYEIDEDWQPTESQMNEDIENAWHFESKLEKI